MKANRVVIAIKLPLISFEVSGFPLVCYFPRDSSHVSQGRSHSLHLKEGKGTEVHVTLPKDLEIHSGYSDNNLFWGHYLNPNSEYLFWWCLWWFLTPRQLWQFSQPLCYLGGFCYKGHSFMNLKSLFNPHPFSYPPMSRYCWNSIKCYRLPFCWEYRAEYITCRTLVSVMFMTTELLVLVFQAADIHPKLSSSELLTTVTLNPP